jgi:predicted acetyltransferase
LFYAVHEDDAGTPDAFAMYGTKHEWPRGLPSAEMSVKRHVAATPAAGASLWRFLFDVDLVSRVKTWSRPVDDPLLVQLTEPRSLRAELSDALFLRPLHVEGALAARGYAADGRVVLEVADSFLPANDGTYELVVDQGVPVCRRVEGPAEVVCSVHAIGHTYLGAFTWAALAAAGLLEVPTPGALDTLDAMFRTDVAPWPIYYF